MTSTSTSPDRKRSREARAETLNRAQRRAAKYAATPFRPVAIRRSVAL